MTRWIAIAFGVLVGACSSPSTGGFVSGAGGSGAGTGGGNGIGTGGATGTATGGAVGTGGNIVATATGGVGGSGAPATGAVGGAISGSGGAAGGATGQAAGAGGTARGGSSGATGAAAVASNGCGKAPPAATGMIGTGMAQYGKFTITVTGQTVVQFNAMTPAQPVTREYFVRLPDNYDNTKPYRVVYQGPGCGPTQDSQPTTLKGQAPFATDAQTPAARTDAILVQLEPGTYNPAAYNPANCLAGNTSGCNATSAYCFDDWASEQNSPQVSTIPDGRNGSVAMERAYFGALHTAIESNYCVDKTRQFYSGYSSGGWLAQQLGCWFPDVLRAQANVTGSIPDIINSNAMGANDYCVKHPIAYFSIHNNPDTSNAFQGSVDGARRVFALNGCTGPFPGGAAGPPQPGAATIPAGLEVFQISDPAGKVLVPNNSTLRCYHYTTCPAAYPMYFCVTNIAAVHDAQGATAAPAFWEFFRAFSLSLEVGGDHLGYCSGRPFGSRLPRHERARTNRRSAVRPARSGLPPEVGCPNKGTTCGGDPGGRGTSPTLVGIRRMHRPCRSPISSSRSRWRASRRPRWRAATGARTLVFGNVMGNTGVTSFTIPPRHPRRDRRPDHLYR